MAAGAKRRGRRSLKVAPLAWLLALLLAPALQAGAAPPDAPSTDTLSGVIGDTWAQLNFTTNQSVIGGAEWGDQLSLDEAPHFEHSVNETIPSKTHSVTLTGLVPAGLYHVRLTVRSPSGETNASAPFGLKAFDSRWDPSVPLWADAFYTAALLGGAFALRRRADMRRWSAVAGVACAVGIFAVTLLTSLMIPGFTLGKNAVSDLGDPPQGWLFNWGLVALAPLGALMIVFALRPALRKGLLRDAGIAVGVVFAALAGLIGVYTERTPELHSVISQAVFGGAALCAALLARPILREKRLALASGGLLIAAGALFVLTLVSFSGLAEGLAVFLIIAWNGVTGWLLIPRRGNEPAPAAP